MYVVFLQQQPEPCNPGQYSLSGWQNCTSCPPGYACPSIATNVNNFQCRQGKLWL